MGVGVAGAMVDVTTYADISEGINYSWGRHAEFDDVPPGTFSFVLDNYDGRFTPDNSASSLSTLVVEGMPVVWRAGSGAPRLISGKILSIAPLFPGSNAAWGQVRITCDDMLGDAGRQELAEFPNALVEAATRFLLWPLDESSGQDSAVEYAGGPEMLPYNYNFGTALESGGWVSDSTFGSEPQAVNLWPRLRLSGTSNAIDILNTVVTGTAFPYPTTSMGFWGFWATGSDTSYADITVRVQGNNSGFTLRVSAATFYFTHFHGTTSTAASTAITPGLNYYSVGVTTSFSAGSWFRQMTVYVNGVAAYAPAAINVGAALDTAMRQPARVNIQAGGGTTVAEPTLISRLSHTLEQVHEEAMATQTLTGMVSALRYVAPSITIDTVPANFSTAPATFTDGASSVLTRLNEIARTEQGYLYTVETGTTSAPVPKIRLRYRDRPTTVTASFDAELELKSAPDFIRDITDMVSSVNVSTPAGSLTYRDFSLTARLGSSNASETIASTAQADALMWAQDRVNRGANVKLRIATIEIDAMTTPTDRSSDLLALVPGDRIRVTGLPSAQLGFSTWDGWLLGSDETHTLTDHTFALNLAAVLPDTAIFDTDRLMADGILTLSASINSAVTSLSVATTGATLSTTETPYTIIIGTEKMTVTACSGATPQVLTVTRAAGGTTAAAHTVADLVEISPSALLAF